MNPRLWNATRVALFLYSTAFCSLAFAQSQRFPEGKRLPVISATAATGRWLTQAALDPATYGSVRGVAPATSPDSKIVLYTGALSEDFFKIAVAVDHYIANRPELSWSFVQVKDAKGAQRGGYTADELRARLAEIQGLAQKHGIKHLSFLVAAPGSQTTTPDPTVVIAYVQRVADKPNVSAVVRWVTEMSATALQGDTLTNQLASLDAATHKP